MAVGDDDDLLAVAGGLVPLVADGCTLDVVVEDVSVRAAAVHVEPRREVELGRMTGREGAARLVDRETPSFRVELALWGAVRGGPFADALADGAAERAATLLALRRAEVRQRDAESARHTVVTMLRDALGGPLQGLTVGLHLVETRLNDSADEVPRPWLAHRCAQLSAATERLRTLADRLLDARIPSDEALVLTLEHCEMGEVVRRATLRLHDTLGPPVVRLTQERPIRGLWDPVHLETVVANLVNVVAKEGVAKVAVDLRSDDDGVTVTIDEATEAPGRAPRRFEPVRRATFEGGPFALGVPVAIAQKLVEAHGGDLAWERRRGRTAFRMTVPRQALGHAQLEARGDA